MADRPQTRGDCLDGLRPCPYVGCRHHLAHGVLPAGDRSGAARLLRRLDVVEERVLRMIDTGSESCSLDVADRGAHTHEQVAALIETTKPRCGVRSAACWGVRD